MTFHDAQAQEPSLDTKRKCKTHLFQLKLSTPSAVCIRVQASGEQGPHGGGIHGEGWIWKEIDVEAEDDGGVRLEERRTKEAESGSVRSG